MKYEKKDAKCLKEYMENIKIEGDSESSNVLSLQPKKRGRNSLKTINNELFNVKITDKIKIQDFMKLEKLFTKIKNLSV